MRIKLTATLEYDTKGRTYPFKSNDPRDYVAHDLRISEDNAEILIDDLTSGCYAKNVIITAIDEVHGDTKAEEISLQAAHVRKLM